MSNPVFVLWQTWRHHWPEILVRLPVSGFEVIRQADIPIHDQTMMKLLLLDIYMHQLSPKLVSWAKGNVKLTEKAKVLAARGGPVRAIEARWCGEGPSWVAAEAFKDGLRAEFPKIKGLTTMKGVKLNMHSTGDAAEEAYLPDLLFNPRSIAHLRARYLEPRPMFVDRLDLLRSWCRISGLNPRDLCVISGSVLEVFGIRYANDLDVILPDEVRARVRAGTLPWPPIGIDYATGRQYHPTFTNQELLDREHFNVLGIKFATLPAVVDTKRAKTRAKDASDLELFDRPFNVELVDRLR